jgi:hypothetical protein
MLLGMQIRTVRSLFAKLQKTPKLIAELRQQLD